MSQEGLIKFQLNHVMRSLDEINIQLESLFKIRKKLFSKKMIGVDNFGVGYGNISIRIDFSDHFLITGTQTSSMPIITKDEMVLVRGYDPKKFTIDSCGQIKPSSESSTHATLYQMDKKIISIIHIHNFSLWKNMIEQNFHVSGDLEYGTKELSNNIREIFSIINNSPQKIFPMKGHEGGVISYGQSIEEAYEYIHQKLKEYIL